MVKSWCKMMREFIRLFFSQSSIHGFRQIVDPNSYFEKFLWFSLISLAVYGVSVLSEITLRRYIENPTVISMERDRLTWNTTFPAATVCPTFKLSQKLLTKYVEDSKEENKTLLREFLISLSLASYHNFDSVLHYDGIKEEDFAGILDDLKFEFNPTVTNTGSDGNKYGLEKILTEMGICYCFNSKLAVYSSPNYWKEENWKLVAGNSTFYIHPLDGEVFTNFMNMSTGFDMYIHGPYEMADIASKKILGMNGHYLQIYLKALTLFSSQSVRFLRISQRKCRFNDESDLRHFPAYSYVLCRMECRAALAQKLCGCIPHFYRKLEGEKICNINGLHCLGKHKDILIQLKGECSCLPNCDEVNYIIDDMDTKVWFLGSNLQWGLKDYPKMRLRRDIIFGFSDLLVYIGGMAGLFLGCSVLSFIEILYFFTLRLFWFVLDGYNNRGRTGN